MNSSKKYKPPETFYVMCIQNFIWGLLGILLGICVNNTIIFMTIFFNIENIFIQNTLQLILCSFSLALVQYLFNYFGWSWQNITPGLFFISFFFGVQYEIFTNIQDKYIKKRQ